MTCSGGRPGRTEEKPEADGRKPVEVPSRNLPHRTAWSAMDPLLAAGAFDGPSPRARTAPPDHGHPADAAPAPRAPRPGRRTGTAR
ncbi:hypothetical protein GCM10009564_45730 [Streptomyces thermogriseus]|uniref:Uncharacterized protein n=1 Tax=Streptomyces thermogriseus TaxID=75292 RepID=A0ABP4DMB6_9ACTN